MTASVPPVLASVNVARPRPNPHKQVDTTGIDKRPVEGAVFVHDPGGTGTGVVGDFIGDTTHHGGRDQALYAFAREDLDDWQRRLGRPLPNGYFGENLTTRGLDVNAARVGERWQIGATVVVQVTLPRIPCSTFRGWVDEKGWLKTFTQAARPGAYLRVLTPGPVGVGDPITVIHRPVHDITIALMFRALTTERNLLPRLLDAGDDLAGGLREELAGLQ